MMRSHRAVLIAGGILLVGTGIVAARPRAPQVTPEPTEAELRAFVRLMPIAFRPAIAAEERRAGALRSSVVPIGVGVESGQRFRIVFPTGVRGGHFNTDASRVSNGVYTTPSVPAGHLVETADYLYTSITRRIHFVGSRGTTPGSPREGRILDGHLQDGLLADGESTLRDLGPLPKRENGLFVNRSPVSAYDVGLAPLSGPAPRLVAFAPAELPPSTKAEPGGYALLLDTATLWRQRGSTQSMSATLRRGLGTFLPVSWNVGFVRYSGEQKTYQVSALAHVYVREDGRWRYARTWRLLGSGDAWFSDKEPELAKVQRGPGGRPVAFGCPDVLKASRIEALLP